MRLSTVSARASSASARFCSWSACHTRGDVRQPAPSRTHSARGRQRTRGRPAVRPAISTPTTPLREGTSRGCALTGNSTRIDAQMSFDSDACRCNGMAGAAHAPSAASMDAATPQRSRSSTPVQQPEQQSLPYGPPRSAAMDRQPACTLRRPSCGLVAPCVARSAILLRAMLRDALRCSNGRSSASPMMARRRLMMAR